MYRSQADAVKDWLLAYRNNIAKIDDKLEEIRTLKARMTSIGAQEITDMPKGQGASKDRMTEYLIRLETMEAEVNYEIAQQDICKETIIHISESLKRKEAREIIRHRYLFGREWSDVLQTVYGKNPDYSSKLNTYKRKMFRTHDSALKEISKHWTPADDKTREGNGENE